MRTGLLLAALLIAVSAYGQGGPILRQCFTTNAATGFSLVGTNLNVPGLLSANSLLGTNGLKLMSGAGSGKFLMSDANGAGAWVYLGATNVPAGAGDTVWTNDPFTSTITLVGTQLVRVQLNPYQTFKGMDITMKATNGYDEGYHLGLRVNNSINSDPTTLSLYYQGACYGIVAESGPGDLDGQSMSLFAYADGNKEWQYGIGSEAICFQNGQTNIAIAGSVVRNNKTGVFVSGYFEASDNETTDPVPESAVLLLENKQTGLPLIVARTNSGTTVFSVTENGSIKLSGQTNDIADNGSAVTFNSVPIGGWATTNGVFAPYVETNYFAVGIDALDGSALNDAQSVVAIGEDALQNSILTNSCADIFAYGKFALQNAIMDGNCIDIFAYGASAMKDAILDPGSADIYAFGQGAGQGMTGVFTHVFLVGSGAQATGNSEWVAGDFQYHYKFPGVSGFDVTSTINATTGIGSTATDTAVPIDATGWTNTMGKNAVVDFDGTAMTFVIYNSAGTALYTNTVAHTGAMSRVLQPNGAITISGTGVAGVASPF